VTGTAVTGTASVRPVNLTEISWWPQLGIPTGEACAAASGARQVLCVLTALPARMSVSLPSPSLPLSRRSCCRHIEQCCRHTDTVDTLIAAVGVRLSTHCCVVPFFYHIVLSSLSLYHTSALLSVLPSQCCPLSAGFSLSRHHTALTAAA
jgi:hypothetical protein